MQSLQVVYRVTVMIGSLVVGALAYRAYGPELEKLEPVLARVQQLAAEAWSGSTSPNGTGELDATDLSSQPAAFQAAAIPLASIEPPPLLDTNLQPVAAWGVSEPAPPAQRSLPVEEQGESPVAAVVRTLNELGVTEYALTKWGVGSQMYRFHCSVPWGLEGRYSRHFEAIAPDPADAARQVLEQVERSQLAE